MATEAQMREAVKNMHPESARWARRVKHMGAKQITAIYLRDLQSPPKPQPEKKDKPQDETLF